MTLASAGYGSYYLADLWPFGTSAFGQALDATGEKLAMIGHIYWNGRPGSAKTFSAAGGGSISFRNGAVTFADGGTSVLVGVQDVATGTGPVVVPDETFDVQSAALVGGGGAFVANTYTTISMTGGSGSKSITHGDLIAIVFDMTARAGSDSVTFNMNGAIPSTMFGRPIPVVKIAGAWSAHGAHPNVLITADDGTIGMLDGYALPFSTQANESFSDSVNPDERGLIFQVPWDCQVDAIWHSITGALAGSDFSLKLYSDPTGTPSALVTMAQLGEQYTIAASRPSVVNFPAPIDLTKNTNYAVTALATGASSITAVAIALGNQAHRALWEGGTTVAKVTRDGSTGAFTVESPAVTRYNIGVRISHYHDTSGAGAAESFGAFVG